MRYATCMDCSDVITGVPARGCLPERCSPCRKARARAVRAAYRERRNSKQRAAWARKAATRPIAPPAILTCLTCGVLFERRSRKGTPPLRCDLCRAFVAALATGIRQKRFFDGEDFKSSDIFERDGHLCYLCDLPCVGNFPDPMSASLDHVIPVARGGRHLRENVRTAHLLCNMSKGVRNAGLP